MGSIVNEDARVPLPSAKPFNVDDDIIIQPPLSRRGHGPGLILLVPQGLDLGQSDKTLDPPPAQKWAEEGYAVAQITAGDKLGDNLGKSMDELKKLPEIDQNIDSIGIISYNVVVPQPVLDRIEGTKEVKAIVTYGSPFQAFNKPQLRHLSGESSKVASDDVNGITSFNYPGAGDLFIIPSHSDYNSAKAAVSHTRCLSFLKPLMKGPYFDLEAIWEEHTKFEFADRAVEKTMGTMVQEPYVNHIPTMTGGVGRKRLTNFYRHHFIFSNPDDTALELVSRTVGIDRVIDEFVFSFTHDRTIDWLIPGIPPTGKHVEIPFTSVVNIRGDRLYHEHIAWDQATVLRQLGLMPDYLPFPYALPDGRAPAQGKRFEYRVPTAGVNTARKLVDESAVESNGMFEYTVREVDDS